MTKIKKLICLMLYYGIAYYLPNSYKPWWLGGKISNAFRVFLCKQIFKKAGKISTINRCVNFGSGKEIEIGDFSGIGADSTIPSNTKIGNYVMMGQNLYILARNHNFTDTLRPMCEQGFYENKQTIIEDDVWIGMNVIMTPGRIVKKGCIIAASTTLCKDFPEYSIVGGNPAKLIRSRLSE